ncbi:MAG: hypothetical protein NVV68_07360 [Dokdonella sp.]|nr:hypothetical protein [Dokdonella sp.]
MIPLLIAAASVSASAALGTARSRINPTLVAGLMREVPHAARVENLDETHNQNAQIPLN